MTESLVGIEKLETEAFAYVVFAAKVITWTALLTLAAVVEFALVRKIYRAEFGKKERSAARPHESETMAGMGDRYIRASELRSFAYFERAWRLEYDGTPFDAGGRTCRRPPRVCRALSRAVGARTVSYIGAALLGFGIVGVVISLAFWALHK